MACRDRGAEDPLGIGDCVYRNPSLHWEMETKYRDASRLSEAFHETQGGQGYITLSTTHKYSTHGRATYSPYSIQIALLVRHTAQWWG